eukprot:gnl/TRDRNA2_/TRDRNA2_176311_c0_seq32.p1 gnl/TRDRNA2_/TRDRNA2_176311_c0~~gnl/TRDRNA2_/TRDRNA2_176311_c0_seq32.p1  ORF type:complete len:325 (+),score=50.63 gnl/TRDRNA2_/TRDRNA2_176311_c0_seq32:65-1039(+)
MEKGSSLSLASRLRSFALARPFSLRVAWVTVLAALLRYLWQKRWRRRLLAQAQEAWTCRVDLSVVQAVLMSSERLGELGRVEKRTLFVKSITDVFKNQYIRDKIVEAAMKGAETGDPFIMKHFQHEDKWHVLVECLNHISSLFAPHHLFFNECSRAQVYYRSSWYCFTLTCHQDTGAGRFFITPHKPLNRRDDVGMMRVRIVMVSEKELRSIAEGSIEPRASGCFNERHQNRWEVLERFAAMFQRQLQHEDSAEKLTAWQGMLSRKNATGFRLDPPDNHDPDDQEENAFLRVHVPFPSTKSLPDPKDKKTRSSEIGAQDVVLFE